MSYDCAAHRKIHDLQKELDEMQVRVSAVLEALNQGITDVTYNPEKQTYVGTKKHDGWLVKMIYQSGWQTEQEMWILTEDDSNQSPTTT